MRGYVPGTGLQDKGWKKGHVKKKKEKSGWASHREGDVCNEYIWSIGRGKREEFYWEGAQLPLSPLPPALNNLVLQKTPAPLPLAGHLLP